MLYDKDSRPKPFPLFFDFPDHFVISISLLLSVFVSIILEINLLVFHYIFFSPITSHYHIVLPNSASDCRSIDSVSAIHCGPVTLNASTFHDSIWRRNRGYNKENFGRLVTLSCIEQFGLLLSFLSQYSDRIFPVYF